MQGIFVKNLFAIYFYCFWKYILIFDVNPIPEYSGKQEMMEMA
jgi:hypothetical protein